MHQNSKSILNISIKCDVMNWELLLIINQWNTLMILISDSHTHTCCNQSRISVNLQDVRRNREYKNTSVMLNTTGPTNHQRHATCWTSACCKTPHHTLPTMQRCFCGRDINTGRVWTEGRAGRNRAGFKTRLQLSHPQPEDRDICPTVQYSVYKNIHR